MITTTKLHQIWAGTTKKLVLVVALLALLASACSTVDSLSSSADTATDASDGAENAFFEDESEEAIFETSGDDEEAFEEEAMQDEEEAMEDSEDSAERATTGSQLASGSTAAAQIPTDLGRDIIFTAQVTINVDDVAVTGRQATEIISDLGGFVFGEDSTGGANPQTTLTFKVRPQDFSTALEELSGIGELTSQRITTDDVTERVVDLQSRINTTELGVERLRTAMEEAANLNAFAQLEQQLLARESDLEVLRGTLRTLRDRIDLATITLTISQEQVRNGIDVRASQYEGFDAGQGCPGIGGPGSLDPGDEITICFEVVNVGDQTLTNVELTDSVLDISASDLTVAFGDPADLAPGQSVMFAYDHVADRDINLRVSVVATPTNGTDSEPAGPIVRTTLTPRFAVDQSQVSAGFGDGFDAGAALLARIWATAQVIAGFVLPLLALAPLLWLLRKALLSLRGRKNPVVESASGNDDGDGGNDPDHESDSPDGDGGTNAPMPPPPEPALV